jgi:hypothetical protein
MQWPPQKRIIARACGLLHTELLHLYRLGAPRSARDFHRAGNDTSL